jgi:hypothetical protein
MICRGKGFLVVLRFLAPRPPTPSLPHLPSVSLTGDTQEDWERETAWWREKVNGQEMGYRSRIIQLQESLILYKSLNTLCSTHCTTTWHKLANRGGVYKQSVQKTPSACIICIHGDLHVAHRVCFQNMFQKLAFFASLSNMLCDKYGSHSVKKVEELVLWSFFS